MFAAKRPQQRRSNSSKLFFVRRNNLRSKVSFEENTPSGGSHGPRTFTSPLDTPLSTTKQKTGQPHNCYKYLGVYIFTANHEAQTLALAQSETRSFFTTLQPLRLTLSEYILLVNVQLIPILSYRLMAHPLALNELGALQAMIWQNIAHDPSPDKANRISRLVSPKDRYTPSIMVQIVQGGAATLHDFYINL